MGTARLSRDPKEKAAGRQVVHRRRQAWWPKQSPSGRQGAEGASRPEALVCLDSVGRLGMSSVLHPWEESISHKIRNKAQMLLSSFMASFSRGPCCVVDRAPSPRSARREKAGGGMFLPFEEWVWGFLGSGGAWGEEANAFSGPGPFAAQPSAPPASHFLRIFGFENVLCSESPTEQLHDHPGGSRMRGQRQKPR